MCSSTATRGGTRRPRPSPRQERRAAPALLGGHGRPVGELGLVVNGIVLWNTRYLKRALEQWQQTEGEPTADEVARFSPLLHEHVNVLGRCDFTLPNRIAAGELRPLHSPTDWEEHLAEIP